MKKKKRNFIINWAIFLIILQIAFIFLVKSFGIFGIILLGINALLLIANLFIVFIIVPRSLKIRNIKQ